MEIQVPQYCKHYTKNENMNKTCKSENMCKIYYDEICKEYKEKEDENSLEDNNNSDAIPTNGSDK